MTGPHGDRFEPAGDDAGGLGSDARALIDAARAGLSPDAAAVRRVHAGVRGAVTSGGLAGTALAAKLGIVAIAVTIAAGAALYARRSSAPGAPIAVPTRAPEPPAPVARSLAPRPSPSDAVDPDLITIEAPAAPAPGRKPPLRRAPVAAPARSPATASTAAAMSRSAPRSAAPIELGREVELVDRAMAALRRGDPDEALRVVRVYAAEAGDRGQLTQDADAIAVEALCRLRDPGAGDRLAQFAARFPRSAQRARLAAVCR